MDITLQYFENLKAQIKAEEQKQVANIKERVLREIQPKYAEIDQMKAEEINLLTSNYNANRNSANEQYNAQLVALQQDFENKKKEVIQLAQSRKDDLLNSTLQSETYVITKQCGQAIIDINNLIEKRTEKE